MSIALERNDMTDHRFKRPGFVNGMACFPIYKSPEFGAGDRCALGKQEDEEEDDRTTSSSSSSSIGRNSDESPAGRSSSDGGAGDCDGDGEEVQSAFKPGGLDNLEALENVLPIKRGISKFYGGKSKSFTSLADAASCSSLKDIVKQEDAYTRKRKNLLAHNNFFDKNCNHFPRSNIGRIFKRSTNSRTSLALAATGSCFESSNCSESLNSSPSSSPRLSLPHLPPQSRRHSNGASLSLSEQKFSTWRSFSLCDLRGDAAAIPNLTGIKE